MEILTLGLLILVSTTALITIIMSTFLITLTNISPSLDLVFPEWGNRTFTFPLTDFDIAQKDFNRFAELEVIASVQPYHAIDDGRWAERSGSCAGSGQGHCRSCC